MRILLITFLLISTSVFSQSSIGVKLPNKNTDLTLGSENKGMLPNRVQLQDVLSAAPLKKENMVAGTLVYNTTVDPTKNLVEGYYFWHSSNGWSRLYIKYVPTRDMNFLAFKKTTKEYLLPDYDIKVPIDELNYVYKAEENGTLFLDLSIYSTMAGGSVVVAGNTYCFTTIVDETGAEVFNGVTTMSPFVATVNEPGKITVGISNFSIPVVKGKTYNISHIGEEYWAGNNYKVAKPTIGTLSIGGKKVYSSMKVTFLSELSL